MRALPDCTGGATADTVRTGILISADPLGRSGSLRTFWLTRCEPQEPLLAAVETLIDLDGGPSTCPPEALLQGEAIAVFDSRNPQVDRLLQCAGFRLEPSWQRYYFSVATGAETRAQVIERSLAAVAFDLPILLALFLLMAVRDDLAQLPVKPFRLNAKRARLGRRPLLEHIELSAPVFAGASVSLDDGARGTRRGPRFHHVRGHLVRRRNTIYWRGPHWRGHVRLGSVRTRTVELRLPG
ncbi:MAG: hypothetical protein E6K38_13515 [Gammaproteobacteria bacterium]|nr:MAG: hypothetical protein E6K38_13515 [Gammaproteobacteria bacterium]